MAQARIYGKSDRLVNACGAAGERLAPSSLCFLFCPWLLFFLHRTFTSTVFFFFFSFSFICLKQAFNPSSFYAPIHLLENSLVHFLAPTWWWDRRTHLQFLRALRFKCSIDLQEAQLLLPEPIPEHKALLMLHMAEESGGRRKEATSFLQNMLSVAKH